MVFWGARLDRGLLLVNGKVKREKKNAFFTLKSDEQFETD